MAVGLILNKKHGDFVSKGESLATIHANDLSKLALAKERLLAAYEIVDEKVEKRPVIKRIIM